MKRTMLFTLLLTLLLSTAGCGGEPTPSPQENQKVTVLLDWFPNTNHTGLYAAQENGYFTEEGLDVEIIQPAEGGTAQLIAAGQGDFGISYQEEVTIARSQDIPVRALAAVIQHNTSGFAAPTAKGIKSPADFEGKIYGGWGSPAETAMLKTLMDNNNADFSKVSMVNIGDADFFTSVEKNIDFSWIYYGWTGIEAEQRGMDLNFIALKDEESALDFYTPVIISSEKQLSENPELVKNFMHAVSRGYNFCIENPEDAASVLLKAVPELDAELVKGSQIYLAKQYQADAPRWGEMKEQVWKNYADYMFNNNLIDENIDSQQAFTNDFLP
ncbi:MAG: ABC transporter substrate-binding protein [Bacillota bacterium]|nr:ABC transporter substrate-binding protein [Bacillota bacterium]